ncbi:MAG TPA: hypothetical protein VFE27_18740, partial [Acidobacteriaceae bacterium]|nr:hypothetical protein [Acidobacteriaceae bacterium]
MKAVRQDRFHSIAARLRNKVELSSMVIGTMKFCAWFFLFNSIVFLAAQTPARTPPPPLHALSTFATDQPDQLAIHNDIMAQKPFSVIGPRGALLGQQDGSFEAWIFPWKILSHMRIVAEMKDYAVPIDVNEQAASIDVQPGHTTITFSHANFTVREMLFAPQTAPEGAGALAYYQIQAVRPMTLTFSFMPEMQRMWPALSDDRPSPEWVRTGDSGFYILHLNFPNHAAAVAMPTAQYGILPPYQERPKDYPLQFVIHFDPATDSNKIYPLFMTTAETAATSTMSALAGRLQALNDDFHELYSDTQKHFQ